MKKEFAKDALREEISGRMNDLVRLEKNIFLRAVPLEIKNLFLLAGTTLGGRSVTAVYSNIGRIQMPPEYESYIERFGFFASTDKMQMCSSSYGDTLVHGADFEDHRSEYMPEFHPDPGIGGDHMPGGGK